MSTTIADLEADLEKSAIGIRELSSDLADLKRQLKFNSEHLEDEVNAEVDAVLGKKIESYKHLFNMFIVPFLAILSLLVASISALVSWALVDEDFRATLVNKYVLNFSEKFKPEFDAQFNKAFHKNFGEMFKDSMDSEFKGLFDIRFGEKFQSEFGNAFKDYFDRTLTEKLNNIMAISYSDNFDLRAGSNVNSMQFFAEELDRGEILCDAVFPNGKTKAEIKITLNNRDAPIKVMRVRGPKKLIFDSMKYNFVVDDYNNFYSESGIDHTPSIHELNFELAIPNPGEDTIGDKAVSLSCLILVAGEVKFSGEKQ